MSSQKKKSTGSQFTRLFLQSFLVILLVLVMGVGGYSLVQMTFAVEDKQTESSGKRKLEIIADVKTGTVSSNLIYSLNQTTNQIEAVVLEIMNSESHNMDYITIPADMAITVNKDLFAEIQKSYPQMPQVITLSTLPTFFEGTAGYEYGIRMLNDTFGISIGYYTCMTSDTFAQKFSIKEGTQCYVVNPTVTAAFAALSKENTDAWEDAIREEYKSFTTNLDIKKKLRYVEALMAVKPEQIYCHLAPTVTTGTVISMNAESFKVMYHQLLANKEYQTAQEGDSAYHSASLGKRIEVLNSSGISGLAGRTKSKLETAGYTVSKVGDYKTEVFENTIIYVKKESLGKDLLGFFSNATIEVKELTKDVDIRIILGKNEGTEDNS